MGGVATPVVISWKIKAIPGQSGLKQIFGTFPGQSGTVPEIPGQLATMLLTSLRLTLTHMWGNKI